uniref:Stomatin-like protein 2, mitochondrial n=1 Tax=Denticeps clupeoides TaxID=299321 RepID=A0AAY4AMX4_9TELE
VVTGTVPPWRHSGLSVLLRDMMRWASSLPMNTVVLFVPQQEAWVVERMGRFHRILEPGLNFLIPILDRIRYVQSLKEIVIDVPEQSAVSLDNVTLQIDGVLYLRILDPFKASYGVEDPEYAVTQLAQTTMRSELGKLTLDKVFRERESLNSNIVHSINQASDEWGIRCLRYEIKDIHVPPRVKESMQMQVEAERKKRATVLESEGTRESAINVAEGRKQAQILASEGQKTEQINKAAGEASAVLAKAEAKAKAIKLLSEALTKQNGNAAASLSVAEQYVAAFSNLAKESNTIILPSNTGDISSMVTQVKYGLVCSPSQCFCIQKHSQLYQAVTMPSFFLLQAMTIYSTLAKQSHSRGDTVAAEVPQGRLDEEKAQAENLAPQPTPHQ